MSIAILSTWSSYQSAMVFLALTQIGITGYLSYRVLKLTEKDIEKGAPELEAAESSKIHVAGTDEVIGLLTVSGKNVGDGRIEKLEIEKVILGEGEHSRALEEINTKSTAVEPGEKIKFSIFLDDHFEDLDKLKKLNQLLIVEMNADGEWFEDYLEPSDFKGEVLWN